MNGYLGYSSGNNETYALQYSVAFEALINSRDSLRAKEGLVDLPMLFLLRHYLELYLKHNIDYFKDYSGSNELVGRLDKTHDLKKLYSAFKTHLSLSFKKLSIDCELHSQINTYQNSLQLLIDKISVLDNESFSFRYAFDRNGNKYLPVATIVNLIQEIEKPYKNSKPLLEYSINVHRGY